MIETMYRIKDAIVQELADYHRPMSLRDQFAMHCPITFDEFKKNNWEMLQDYTPERVMFEYCEMRYNYADAMMKAREK